MSLRNQPFSERVFATLVILGLGGFLAGGLAFTIRQERSRTSLAPASRSRLMAVLEGVMAPNVSSAETALIRTWVQGGAMREGFAPVEAIAGNNCASCHGPGGQFPPITGYGDLRPLAMEEASDGFYANLGARALHLALFPLVFLVGGFGYLRRTPWAGRRLLLGGCGAAVLFDAAQWYLRQSHPNALWAAWAALGLQSAAFLALAVVVVKELWVGPSSA